MFKNSMRAAVAALTFVLAASSPVLAATDDEAKAMAEKAAALVAAQGEEAFLAFDDPNGEFHKGELYVVVIDKTGTIRAHINSKLIGVNMWEATDQDGIKFTQLGWKATEDSETAWISYKFTNPDTKKIQPKKAWVHRVGDYLIQTGIYLTE
jgi:signal transduction histidine kinase